MFAPLRRSLALLTPLCLLACSCEPAAATGASNEASGLLRLLLESYVGQAATYFVIVGLVFVGLWRLGERRFQGARIQEKRRVDGRQIRREVKHTLVTLLIGTLNAVAITLLYQAGLTRLSVDPAAWSWPVLALSFIGFIVFNDAWFYWWHRFLHRPRVFKLAHAVHHRSVDVNPFTSYSFHALEAFILGAWSIPVLMLVPVYLPLLVVLQVAGLAKNIEAHLGYEFMPRWFIRVPPFKWLTTSTYHNLHHTRFNGNYALFFRGWDRLLGTEVPGYERTFVERGERRTAHSGARGPLLRVGIGPAGGPADVGREHLAAGVLLAQQLAAQVHVLPDAAVGADELVAEDPVHGEKLRAHDGEVLGQLRDPVIEALEAAHQQVPDDAEPDSRARVDHVPPGAVIVDRCVDKDDLVEAAELDHRHAGQHAVHVDDEGRGRVVRIARRHAQVDLLMVDLADVTRSVTGPA